MKETEQYQRNSSLSLLCNFESLDGLIKTYEDSQNYEVTLTKLLKKLAGDSDSEDSIEIKSLYSLEQEVSMIKIEVEKIKQFMGKIQEIRTTEENCI